MARVLCMFSLLLIFGQSLAKRIHETRLSKSAEMPGESETNTSVGHTGTQGQVDGIFALGAPASASPPLRNLRGHDPCLPGFRMWTARTDDWGTAMDVATTCTGILGFRHPYMDALQGNVESKTTQTFKCNTDDVPNLPSGFPEVIHDLELYVVMATMQGDPSLTQASNIGVVISQVPNETWARRVVEQYGWELVGTAHHEGNAAYGGTQHTHLIKKPETRECMLTFQGSSSMQDWVSNFNANKVPFCGLTAPDEACNADEMLRCTSKGSFVHEGFRDHLRDIFMTKAWEEKIRSNMAGCSKVYVAGHSLGGAMSELFAACIQRAPQPGEEGYESDYKYIGWTQGVEEAA